METYFSKFRENIIGNDIDIETPYGIKKMIYADWIASGRLYKPIEKKMVDVIGPFVGNTHSESSETGVLMTKAYHLAQKIIKKHVNAGKKDVIITAETGMTGLINKFQRILGFKICGTLSNRPCISKTERPVVFLTHMEHHSNQTSWYETCADIVILKPNKKLLVDLDELRSQLRKHKDRKIKIGSFTACSNVTGIETPYHEMAKIMHENGGKCFIDFAASAPYVDMNMHPKDPLQKLDAIFFSPHKFLGGPGSTGVLVFDSALYDWKAPDNPGGGTVDWTNPWGEYQYISDIEVREDGGTPGFLQTMRTALSIDVKNKMGTDNIKKREEVLVKLAFKEFSKINKIHILADNVKHRLGIISFYIEDIHYNLIVKLLNDRFGIQARGGCACAGTYGHFLLDVSYNYSQKITSLINSGNLSEKPGWVRISLHPTMTNAELKFVVDAINEIQKNHKKWEKDYIYNLKTNEFRHKSQTQDEEYKVKNWLKI